MTRIATILRHGIWSVLTTLGKFAERETGYVLPEYASEQDGGVENDTLSKS